MLEIIQSRFLAELPLSITRDLVLRFRNTTNYNRPANRLSKLSVLEIMI